MLNKFFIVIFVFFISFLHSSEFKKEKLQILANDLNSKENLIIAKGDVVIFSPSYYILAQKVVYNKQDGLLELFDDVLILKDNKIQTQSDYAFLDLKNELITQNPVFILEKRSNVWIASKNTSKDKDNYKLNNSILSSCNCIDPFWSIKFSSADYDIKDEWLNTYNTRLYIKETPILYTPYLGFSTNTKRRTGLLIPKFGYSSQEGFLYSQPYFIAPQDNYDFELIPQIRTNRGSGMYAYYRYVDSIYSKLEIKSGYFEEKDSYVASKSLKNENHYGFNIDYLRERLVSSNGSEDGLIASINWLNDIEYINLENDSLAQDSEKKIESKIDYFYNENRIYLGSYFRYYLDASKNSNDETLQQLPQIQFHKYTDKFLFDKVLYSSDVQYSNYYRKTGINAQKTDIFVPISYGFDLFNDYLKFKIQEEFTISKINYSNTNTYFKDATFIENRHILSLSSNLLKPYEKGIHNLDLDLSFIIPNEIKSDGDIYNINSINNELEPFPIDETTKTLTLSLNQSWTDINNLQEIINHKLKQSIIYDGLGNSELGDLENEIRYNYLFGTLSNRLIYSNLDDELTELSSSISFSYLNYFLSLGHYLSKNTPNSNKEDLESYTLNLGYDFYKNYSIVYEENYDLDNNIRNKQGFTFGINDSCWSLNLKLLKEIVPTASNSSNSLRQDIVYIQLELKPIGGLNQEYKLGGD